MVWYFVSYTHEGYDYTHSCVHFGFAGMKRNNSYLQSVLMEFSPQSLRCNLGCMDSWPNSLSIWCVSLLSLKDLQVQSCMLNALSKTSGLLDSSWWSNKCRDQCFTGWARVCERQQVPWKLQVALEAQKSTFWVHLLPNAFDEGARWRISLKMCLSFEDPVVL
jgi:hypothetical protein